MKLICTYCVFRPIDTDINFIKLDLHVSYLTKVENEKKKIIKECGNWKGGGRQIIHRFALEISVFGLNRKPGRVLWMLTTPTGATTGEFTQGLNAFNQNNPLQTTRP